MQHRVHCAPTCEQREEGLAEEVVEAAVKALISAVIGAPRCGKAARASGDEDCNTTQRTETWRKRVTCRLLSLNIAVFGTKSCLNVSKMSNFPASD